MAIIEKDIIEIYPKLKAYVKNLSKNPETAEDIVQTTILKALENKEQLKDVKNLTAWLITICRNKFLDSVKKVKESQFNENINENEVMSDGSFEDFELKNIYENCIQKIKEKEKEALLLSFFEKMTIKDIATRLNKPQNTVLTWIANSKKQFVLCVENQHE